MLGRCLGVLICFYLLAFTGLTAFASPVIHLGVLDWRDKTASANSWAPTLAALEQHLPDKKIQLHQLNFTGLAAALAEQKLDYLITNPGHYVQLSQTYQLAPLATLNNPFYKESQQALGSVVLTLAEKTQVQTWQDLRHLTLGAVSYNAFGGFQLVWDELAKQGINPKSDIAAWKLTGFPMEQLFELLVMGEVDAIVVRSCLAEMLAAEGRINFADYRVIGEQKHSGYPCLTSSQLYPDWPFLSTGKQSTSEVTQVLQALLQPLGEQPAQWSAPLAYQPVYELFERLRLGPFAAFPKKPLLNLFYQYRYPLLLGLAILLLIFAHHIRVSYLVAKRGQELKQALLASQEKQKELAHLSRFTLMGELAAGLAHELNQPLTALVNYAQGSQRLLQQLDKQDFPHQKALLEAAQKIATQGVRAAEIIRNLRAFMRKGTSTQEQLNTQQLLQEVSLLMETSLERQQVVLKIHQPEKPPLIRVNRVEFLQILINLVSNALDAMQHKPAGRIDIFVTLDKDRQQVVFDVIDQGEGLKQVTEEQAFEPFFTTRQEGMGLGLGLSKTLAKAQGASLSLLPHSGGGVCAHLAWPLANR